MTGCAAALIVRNEASTLPACLASVRPWVDEMIVVDTGSTDGTPEVARKAGAHVHSVAWCDDFSAARNASLAHCSRDWVLVLDADERLDGASGSLLATLVREASAPAWRFTVRNYLPSGTVSALGDAPRLREGGPSEVAGCSHQQDFQALRFFRRAPWVRFRGRIHELVDDCFRERGARILDAPGLIHHVGKLLPGREEAKRSTYLALAQEDARRQPGSTQAQFNLLQQALMAWAWPTVLEAAEAYTRLSPTGPALVLLGKALALQAMGRHAEALAWFDRLLTAEPSHPLGTLRRAVTLAALGQIEEAMQGFEAACCLAPAYALVYLNWSETAGSLGQWGMARDVLEQGLQRMPQEALLWEALVQLGLREAQTDIAARDAWRALQALPTGGQGLWHRLVALSLARLGKFGEAQAVLALGLKAFPQDSELERLRTRLAEV